MQSALAQGVALYYCQIGLLRRLGEQIGDDPQPALEQRVAGRRAEAQTNRVGCRAAADGEGGGLRQADAAPPCLGGEVVRMPGIGQRQEEMEGGRMAAE